MAPGRVEAVADAAWVDWAFCAGVFGVAISQSPQPNCGPCWASFGMAPFRLGTSVGLCDFAEDLRALGPGELDQNQSPESTQEPTSWNFLCSTEQCRRQRGGPASPPRTEPNRIAGRIRILNARRRHEKAGSEGRDIHLQRVCQVLPRLPFDRHIPTPACTVYT
jgi:hypothetical protein